MSAGCGFIETHFALWADEAFSQSCVAGFQRAREKSERQLTLPVELREDKQTDSQITGFITTLNEAIESAESRRIDAEETSNYLKSEFEGTYTLEFWDLLNHLKVEEMWPRLEKFFGESGENTDEDEEEGGESGEN